MSYFLLLKPFNILSGMVLLDGEDSPYFHEPRGEKLPKAKSKDGQRNMGRRNSWFGWPDVLASCFVFIAASVQQLFSGQMGTADGHRDGTCFELLFSPLCLHL